MKIYTKTGDEGKTSLFDNSRVWKSDERILSYGAVDELNSSIGVALSLELDPEIKDILIKIQNDLFIVGSDLANPKMSDKKIRTTPEMITFLEQKMDLLEPQLEPLTSFILPGGHYLHLYFIYPEPYLEEQKHTLWLYLELKKSIKMQQFT